MRRIRRERFSFRVPPGEQYVELQVTQVEGYVVPNTVGPQIYRTRRRRSEGANGGGGSDDGVQHLSWRPDVSPSNIRGR